MRVEALESYKGLVYRMAQSFGVADQDDILSVGFEALWRARETYDPDKGAKFTTYAATCILNAMRDECRRRMRRVHGLEIKDDAQYTEREPVWMLEEFMRATISDEETIDLLRLRYGEGQKLREIAVLKNMNLITVYRRLEKGLKLLREAMR